MKFRTSEQKQEDLKKIGWQKYFAILPVDVKLDDGRYMWVYFEYVWKKFIGISWDIGGSIYYEFEYSKSCPKHEVSTPNH